MIFGSQTLFAVQSEFEQPRSKYLFGRICLWVGGKQLGDYDQIVVLTPIADFFRKTLSYQGQRYDATLESKSSQQVLTTVYEALYGDATDETTNQEIHQLWEYYSKFCICPNGCEAFDGELAILLENQGGEKLIWRDYEDRKVYETVLKSGEYEAVIQLFLNWINQLTGYEQNV